MEGGWQKGQTIVRGLVLALTPAAPEDDDCGVWNVGQRTSDFHWKAATKLGL